MTTQFHSVLKSQYFELAKTKTFLQQSLKLIMSNKDSKIVQLFTEEFMEALNGLAVRQNASASTNTL